MTEPQRTERRAYPRFQFVQAMELTVARKTVSGYTYDIGQGGLAFIAETLPGAGPLSVRLSEKGLVFKGKLVGQLSAGKPGLFRYQMRCIRAETLPDEAWVFSTSRLSSDCSLADRTVLAAGDVPPLTWGRRPRGCSEMWTSDSAISWLLRRVGIDAAAIKIPEGGRAPGWQAGLEHPCDLAAGQD